VPLRLVRSIFSNKIREWVNDRCTGKPGTEGVGAYYTLKDDEVEAGLIFVCPGCRQITSIAFRDIDGRPKWNWNNNREKPTCTPSILHSKDRNGCGWHGHLTDGVFEPC